MRLCIGDNMDIKNVIISMITYLIMLNNCLIARLKILDNIVLSIILFINITFMEKLIGSFSIISLFLMIILYISFINKERFINIFLLIFTYISFVIIDNITHLIWSFVGLNMDNHWLIYVLVNYPIFYLISCLISKKVRTIKKQNLMFLPLKIWFIIFINLTLCMLIFIMQVNVIDKIGYSSFILLGGIILYLAYFALTIIMLIMIVRTYNTNAKIKLKQNSYDNLQEYMRQIEEVYQNLRSFKHDYANIMASMAGYIDEGDIDKLKIYYNERVLPIGYKLKMDKDSISRLFNLHIIELKSLISIKLNFAQELNIKVILEIVDKVESINMNVVDLTRIVGVLLDNSIEACQECVSPIISLSIIKSNRDVIIIVKNSYVEQDIDYSKLGCIGISSKGIQRGTGLYNVKSIINEYNNVIMNTSFKNNYFTQCVEVYGSS